jgi:hypothetical protein
LIGVKGLPGDPGLSFGGEVGPMGEVGEQGLMGRRGFPGRKVLQYSSDFN